MHIMVIGTSPERQEVVQTPGELITRMGIDGLEEATDNPDVHGNDMQVLRQRAEDDGKSDSAESEDHGFERRGIFRGKTEWSAVLVVELVDHLVQARSVQSSVKPIVPSVFEDKEQSDLPGHGCPGGERDAGGQTEVLGHRVEEPDLRELDSEMGEEDEFGAGPLFCQGRHFLLLDVRGQFNKARYVGPTPWILYFRK